MDLVEITSAGAITAFIALIVTADRLWLTHLRRPAIKLLRRSFQMLEDWAVRLLARLAKLPALALHAAISEPRYIREALET